MKLGEKIKLLRTEKGLTQPELADKAGIEQSYLSKLENDKAVPSFDIINRVSMALEITGMGLIDSLSQSYVEDHLSHIPEVAAEYAVIKQRRESTMKKQFIAAAMAIVLGIGIFLVGHEELLYPNLVFEYMSNGVVRDGESLNQFSQRIGVINETGEEARLRFNNNRERIDQQFLVSPDEVKQIVKEVPGGRRLFERHSVQELYHIENGLISIFGIMIIAIGCFIFLFNIRFKPD